MSYVKGLVIWKGKPHVFEVHGSEFHLNVRKDYTLKGEIKQVIPNSVKTKKGYFDFVRKNDLILSGTKQERFEMGIPEIKTDEDKRKFVEKLKKFNIRGQSDSPPKGFKANLIIDLDNNILYDSENEWYSEYVKFLPKGWKGKEVSSGEFNSMWKAKLKDVI
jgi:hypothetical protein